MLFSVKIATIKIILMLSVTLSLLSVLCIFIALSYCSLHSEVVQNMLDYLFVGFLEQKPFPTSSTST